MGTKRRFQIAALIGAMALAPRISTAARIQSCAPGAVTPSDDNAKGLLNDMRYYAGQVANHARYLEDYTTNAYFNWQIYAVQLNLIRREVDNLGQRLCALETMRGAQAPWIGRAVDRMGPLIQYLADNTAQALDYGNVHRANFVISYKTTMRNLVQEANALRHQVHQEVKSAF